jgi:hypothetical protein
MPVERISHTLQYDSTPSYQCIREPKPFYPARNARQSAPTQTSRALIIPSSKNTYAHAAAKHTRRTQNDFAKTSANPRPSHVTPGHHTDSRARAETAHARSGPQTHTTTIGAAHVPKRHTRSRENLRRQESGGQNGAPRHPPTAPFCPPFRTFTVTPVSTVKRLLAVHGSLAETPAAVPGRRRTRSGS